MKTKVTLEGTKVFRRKLWAFANAMEMTLEEALITKGIQTGKKLAHQTEMFGNNAKSKRTLENTVAGDFHRVNASPFHILSLVHSVSRRSGAAYIQAYKDGRWSEAERIATKALGARLEVGQSVIVQKQRNKRGRIPQANKTVIVTNMEQALSYKEELMKNVGMAKAGWFSAIRDIKNKKYREPMKWLRKDTKYGKGRIEGKQWGLQVVLENKIEYTKNNLKGYKVNKALRADTKAFSKRMDKVIEHANRS